MSILGVSSGLLFQIALPVRVLFVVCGAAVPVSVRVECWFPCFDDLLSSIYTCVCSGCFFVLVVSDCCRGSSFVWFCAVAVRNLGLA